MGHDDPVERPPLLEGAVAAVLILPSSCQGEGWGVGIAIRNLNDFAGEGIGEGC